MDNQILYYSTNKASEKISFGEALIKGQAPDRGLYLPDHIPQLSKDLLDSFRHKTYDQIAFDVLNAYLSNEIPSDELEKLTKEAYNFDVPIENVCENKYVMRLDQGPTASFKDFAARMMGRLMQHFLKSENRKMLILTATSGDTGSAIANAFYNLESIDVVILYPENEVTERQRKQMTTLGGNIKAISITGKFDDCQAMVKQAFSDDELNHLGLSSANSINIGRLLPQSVYYFWAYSRLSSSMHDKIIFSVPSGNFGDLMGGILAKRMGLPVDKFVVATNENDEVPVYFKTGNYKTIVPSKHCISSAMNVGHPSNMARIIDLYDGQMNEKGEILKNPDLEKLKNDLNTYSATDDITKKTMTDVFNSYKVILEPHGAVGWYGLNEYINEFGPLKYPAVVLETAHPAKFPLEIENLLQVTPELPDSLKGLDQKEEFRISIENNYKAFKAFLQNNY